MNKHKMSTSPIVHLRSLDVVTHPGFLNNTLYVMGCIGRKENSLEP